MQYAFSLLPQVLVSIEKTMAPARLGRYLGVAKNDKNRAVRLYLWNAHLCQEFYFPIQITEVAIRNAVSGGLSNNFGQEWYCERSLTTAISLRSSKEIADVVKLEQAKRGLYFAADHVVAGLSFGFWLSLLNTPMTHRLWSGNIRPLFPCLPPTLHQPDVHKRLEKMRLFRNAVMHHYAIFDKGIVSEWDNLRTILGWLCPESVWLMTHLCNPKTVLSAKPHL